MMTFNKGDQWSKGERLSIVIHYQYELLQLAMGVKETVQNCNSLDGTYSSQLDLNDGSLPFHRRTNG